VTSNKDRNKEMIVFRDIRRNYKDRSGKKERRHPRGVPSCQPKPDRRKAGRPYLRKEKIFYSLSLMSIGKYEAMSNAASCSSVGPWLITF